MNVDRIDCYDSDNRLGIEVDEEMKQVFYDKKKHYTFCLIRCYLDFLVEKGVFDLEEEGVCDSQLIEFLYETTVRDFIIESLQDCDVEKHPCEL